MSNPSERRPSGTAGRRSARSAGLVAAAAVAIAASSTAVAVGASRGDAAGDPLQLRAQLRLVSIAISPPPGAPPEASSCRARTATGSVPGLGSVSETYTWCYGLGPPTCPSELAKPLEATARIVVREKGEIRFRLAAGTRCVELEAVKDELQDFAITGGTGTYERASGSGTMNPTVAYGLGKESWSGTLDVPGLAFDITAPTLSGAAGKTVRAPRGSTRVRVAYSVGARDDVDGAVPASCSPRSGARYPIGRTSVTCSATDASGNTGTASFVVAVKPRR